MEGKPWQHSESYSKTNGYMLDHEILCDVTLLAGETKEEVKCHKFMLASRSPVFYTMFCGALAETESRVGIPDIDAKTLKSMTRFIYTGEINLTMTSAMTLLYAGHKYDIPKLREVCATFLASNVSSENVCDVFERSVILDEIKLTDKCLQAIRDNADDAVKSNGFLHLSRKCMGLIVDQDGLACTESDIYEACKRWAQHRCTESNQDPNDNMNIRHTLGDLLYKIRFPTMRLNDFCDIVASERILSEHEKLAIYTDIIQNSSKSRFSCSMRHEECEYVERFHSIQDKSTRTKVNEAEGISFTVKCPAILYEIAFYLPMEPGTADGRFDIYEDQTKVRSQSLNISFQSGHKIEYIALNKLLTVSPSKTYSITLRLHGSATYIGNSQKPDGKCTGLTFKTLASPPGVSREEHHYYRKMNDCSQIHGVRLAFTRKASTTTPVLLRTSFCSND